MKVVVQLMDWWFEGCGVGVTVERVWATVCDVAASGVWPPIAGGVGVVVSTVEVWAARGWWKLHREMSVWYLRRPRWCCGRGGKQESKEDTKVQLC